MRLVSLLILVPLVGCSNGAEPSPEPVDPCARFADDVVTPGPFTLRIENASSIDVFVEDDRVPIRLSDANGTALKADLVTEAGNLCKLTCAEIQATACDAPALGGLPIGIAPGGVLTSARDGFFYGPLDDMPSACFASSDDSGGLCRQRLAMPPGTYTVEVEVATRSNCGYGPNISCTCNPDAEGLCTPGGGFWSFSEPVTLTTTFEYPASGPVTLVVN